MIKIKVWLEFPDIEESVNPASTANSISEQRIEVMGTRCIIHTINSEDDEDGKFIEER